MNAEVQYITDDSGKKKSVIMDIADYHALLEDLEDLAACAERRNEEAIPHDTFIEELKSSKWGTEKTFTEIRELTFAKLDA